MRERERERSGLGSLRGREKSGDLRERGRGERDLGRLGEGGGALSKREKSGFPERWDFGRWGEIERREREIRIYTIWLENRFGAFY